MWQKEKEAKKEYDDDIILNEAIRDNNDKVREWKNVRVVEQRNNKVDIIEKS